MIRVTEEWKKTWPQAHVGVMAVGGIERVISGESLTEKKRVLTRTLGERYRNREELLSNEIISAYVAYFKKYKKTYHVLLQLESVIFKGKPLPSVLPLVESMFIAELESAILTAGHDADALQMPLSLSVAEGTERYTGIGGKELETKAQDMVMQDEEGVIASVLGGPDARTRITPQTSRCLFVAYAPQGIGKECLKAHFDNICDNIAVFSPGMSVESMEIFGG